MVIFPITFTTHERRTSESNLSRAISWDSILLGGVRFLSPFRIFTPHFAQTATDPHELPMGKLANWIDSKRFAPFLTSKLFPSGKNVITGTFKSIVEPRCE